VTPPEQISFLVSESEIALAYRRQRSGRFRLCVDGADREIDIWQAGGGETELSIDGARGAWRVRRAPVLVCAQPALGRLAPGLHARLWRQRRGAAHAHLPRLSLHQ
jgi:hypothetical protein